VKGEQQQQLEQQQRRLLAAAVLVAVQRHSRGQQGSLSPLLLALLPLLLPAALQAVWLVMPVTLGRGVLTPGLQMWGWVYLGF